MNWLLQRAQLAGEYFEINIAGSRITNIKRPGLVVRDLAALMPFMDLQTAATIAGHELTKETGIACTCGKQCGGYCNFRRDLSPTEWDGLRHYLYLDCKATLDTKRALDDVAAESGYLLSGTIGGSTYKTAKKQLGLPDASWEITTFKEIREAFYGGRCQVFRPAAQEGFAYDLNSAYPAALRDLELPIGEPFTCSGDKARRAFLRSKPGFYLAEVEVGEDMFVPPLPVRTKNRIAYPVGKFVGRWSLTELAYAQELGCRVDPRHAIVFPETAPIFHDYMERIYANRSAATLPALKSWHKTFGNSLYGKLGEGPERTRYYLHPDPEKVRAKQCPGKGNRYCTGALDCTRCAKSRCCPKSHGDFCKEWQPIDPHKTIFGAPYFLIPPNGHSHWAAYLTAHTRIEWHRMAVSKNNGADLLYGDTDSIYAMQDRDRNIGEGLGQWGFEGRIADFLAIAPKMYEYTYPPENDEHGPWRKHARAKGLSGISWRDLEQFRRGEAIVVDRGVKGLRSAAKSGNLFQRKLISRSNKQDGLQFGDRILHADGRTYPVHARQLEWLK